MVGLGETLPRMLRYLGTKVLLSSLAVKSMTGLGLRAMVVGLRGTDYGGTGLGLIAMMGPWLVYGLWPYSSVCGPMGLHIVENSGVRVGPEPSNTKQKHALQ